MQGGPFSTVAGIQRGPLTSLTFYLYGLGGIQDNPPLELPEVIFTYFFAQFNLSFTSGSRTRLGGRENSGGRGRVTLASGTTFLQINAWRVLLNAWIWD